MERNNLVEGMDFNEDHDLSFCDECVYGKHHCSPFPFTKVLMQRKCWWDPFFCGDFEWWNSQHWAKAMDSKFQSVQANNFFLNIYLSSTQL